MTPEGWRPIPFAPDDRSPWGSGTGATQLNSVGWRSAWCNPGRHPAPDVKKPRTGMQPGGAKEEPLTERLPDGNPSRLLRRTRRRE